MRSFTVSLESATSNRLIELANMLGKTTEEVLQHAVEEYQEKWYEGVILWHEKANRRKKERPVSAQDSCRPARKKATKSASKSKSKMADKSTTCISISPKFRSAPAVQKKAVGFLHD